MTGSISRTSEEESKDERDCSGMKLGETRLRLLDCFALSASSDPSDEMPRSASDISSA